MPPFPAYPSTARYVSLGSIQEAMDRVCRSIDAREGLALVIGPPGTGKSLMCGLLVQQYRSSHEVVVLGETPITDSAAFLRHLLHHLGENFEATADADLQLALVDRICNGGAAEGGLLIVVDEAQSLSPEVIESIRMVTNIMRDGEPRVYAVLCGGVKLEETIASSSMEAFTQRVATRCYLHAMNGDETQQYIGETIRACGAEADSTITAEAIAAVHHACMGVPRLVNQLMTEAIDCAEDAGQELITEQVIDTAWAQLQQLPSPMVEEPTLVREGTAIEFGELDEVDPISSEPEEELVSPTHEENEPREDVSEPVAPQYDSPVVETDAICETTCCGAACQQDIQFGDASEAHELESEPASEIPAESDYADDYVEIIEESVPKISPAALFGDFEDEESVTIGSGVAPAAGVAPTATDQPGVPVVPAGQPPADLESMLHQEIIGISSVAAAGLELDGQSDNQSDHVESDPYEDPSVEFSPEPEEVVEDFVCQPNEPESETAEADAPVIWLAETDVPSTDHVEGDDRDLLVIEDEVEIAATDAIKTVDSQEQTISVDFQAMLSRMRSGT